MSTPPPDQPAPGEPAPGTPDGAAPPNSAIALVVCDLHRGWLGHPAHLSDRLGSRTVLEHAVARAASVPQVRRVVLVHPPGQSPLDRLDPLSFEKPVDAWTHDDAGIAPVDLVNARKWALTAWRGGLGQATIYDELMPARPLAEALRRFDAGSALIVRADWCFFDAEFAGRILDRHLQSPSAMKITFSQAPPGLGAVATSRAVLEDLAEHQAGFGAALRYNPAKPAIDPIGRDVNLPVDPAVRSHARRFIYDTPRAIERLRAIAQHLGSRAGTANAAEVVAASLAYEQGDPDTPAAERYPFHRVPQQLWLELTPERHVHGPIVPQHHLLPDRPAFDPALGDRLWPDLGAVGDAAVLVGGHGEPTLHPDLEPILHQARAAGVMGLGIETDLLGLAERADWLLGLPVDLISVRLNADTAATYEREMGSDRFAEAARTLATLLERRAGHGRPWIVPRLVKTPETLADMESFFERWTRAAGHAVIEPFCTVGGRIEDRSPVPMAPPLVEGPEPTPKHRLTVLSDGSVSLCRDDFLGLALVGDLAHQTLAEAWAQTPARLDTMHPPDLCWRCQRWRAFHRNTPRPRPVGSGTSLR
ncbi:MAG: SPASM domain-containing protein [Planctomycetota bacterium]